MTYLSREGCSGPWTGAEKTEGTRRGTLLGEAQVVGSGMYREGRGVKEDGGEGKVESQEWSGAGRERRGQCWTV